MEHTTNTNYEYERTSLRSDLASLRPRFARRRPNLKNTESFRSWSFSTRNDRKTILRILRGDIDFSKKKKNDFWIWGFLDLRKLTIFELFVFSKIWKDNSSKIGFSMKNDPWRFNFQLSTTFWRGVKGWKTEKSQPFCPNLTYSSPRKKCTKLRKIWFFDFSLFQKFEKMIHRKSDSPRRVTPMYLFFTSLRLFAK